MVNKVMLIGFLGQDPEMRYSQSGMAIANVNLATSEKRKDAEGNLHESTEWHRVVCFDKLAELVGEHLNKGSKAYIEGKIQTKQWEDNDGNKRYTTEIIAREVKFL